MKFDVPASTNPIDQLKVVGQPIDRIDGPRKTTGTAPYAYEWHDIAPSPAYGYVICSAIANGRIASIDPTAPSAPPGALVIVTATRARPLGRAQRTTARPLGRPGVQNFSPA